MEQSVSEDSRDTIQRLQQEMEDLYHDFRRICEFHSRSPESDANTVTALDAIELLLNDAVAIEKQLRALTREEDLALPPEAPAMLTLANYLNELVEHGWAMIRSGSGTWLSDDDNEIRRERDKAAAAETRYGNRKRAYERILKARSESATATSH